MSVSRDYADFMTRDASAWWKTRPTDEKLRLTGATDEKEAERRFMAIDAGDKWSLSRGHLKSIAHFNWK